MSLPIYEWIFDPIEVCEHQVPIDRSQRYTRGTYYVQTGKPEGAAADEAERTFIDDHVHTRCVENDQTIACSWRCAKEAFIP